MTVDNFEKALAVTLQQEGGFSNDAADHGGRTMRGITQREYNAWRRRSGQPAADVKTITQDELREIYRQSYWDAVSAGKLPAGLDLAVFDYAVNSGPARAIRALQQVLGLPQTGRMDCEAVLAAIHQSGVSQAIDAYCDARAAFLRRIGHGSQSVFLRGWLSRVDTIRREAHELAGNEPAAEPAPAHLSPGATGADVTRLQRKLRALGYPAGAIDGVFGPQTRRAVLLFQDENNLDGEKGVWQGSYWDVLEEAEPLLPERRGATGKELAGSGDRTIGRLTLLQRLLAFFGFGFLGAGGTQRLQSFPETLESVQTAIEPVQGVLHWAASNIWLLGLVAVIGLAAIVRVVIASHVEAYRNFDYQGPQNGAE
jgi:lysozyme family protein